MAVRVAADQAFSRLFLRALHRVCQNLNAALCTYACTPSVSGLLFLSLQSE